MATSREHRDLLSAKGTAGTFVGWVTYLSRRRSVVPPLPAPARIEPVEDRGTLVVLTPERLTASNPAHVELGQRVRDLLDRARLMQPVIVTGTAYEYAELLPPDAMNASTLGGSIRTVLPMRTKRSPRLAQLEDGGWAHHEPLRHRPHVQQRRHCRRLLQHRCSKILVRPRDGWTETRVVAPKVTGVCEGLADSDWTRSRPSSRRG